MFDITPYLYENDPWVKAQEVEYLYKLYYEKHFIATGLRDIENIFEIGCRAGYMATAFFDAVHYCNYTGIDNGYENYNGRFQHLDYARRDVKSRSYYLMGKGQVKHWDGFYNSLPSGPVDLVYTDTNISYGSIHNLDMAMKIARWIWIGNAYEQKKKINELIEDDRIESYHYYKTLKGDCILELKDHIHSYSHSGDCGDLIASLSVIKQLGGGRLSLTYSRNNRNPFDLLSFMNIRTLLEKQPYITEVSLAESTGDYPDAINLDMWRHTMNGRRSLVEEHAYAMNVSATNDIWLYAPPREVAPIVVNRTSRYNQWSDLTWKRILDHYDCKKVFIGTEAEYKVFNAMYPIEYYPTIDLWSMAQVIAGCKIFIGGQSTPMWIALGLGTTIVQESYKTIPNCKVDRPNFYWCDNDNGIVDSHFIKLPNLC